LAPHDGTDSQVGECDAASMPDVGNNVQLSESVVMSDRALRQENLNMIVNLNVCFVFPEQ
jgi:hypothetical protein